MSEYPQGIILGEQYTDRNGVSCNDVLGTARTFYDLQSQLTAANALVDRLELQFLHIDSVDSCKKQGCQKVEYIREFAKRGLSEITAFREQFRQGGK